MSALEVFAIIVAASVCAAMVELALWLNEDDVKKDE